MLIFPNYYNQSSKLIIITHILILSMALSAGSMVVSTLTSLSPIYVEVAVLIFYLGSF